MLFLKHPVEWLYYFNPELFVTGFFFPLSITFFNANTGWPKKTEPIQTLLNLININRISRNLVDLNINLCTIIPRSFIYFDFFALKLCNVGNMLQMGAIALEASLPTSLKIVTQTDLSFEISQYFAVFSAISLNIDELKTLNTAKMWEILKEKCVGMIDNFERRLQVCLQCCCAHLEHILNKT